MSSITIPDVDDALKARLAVRAARRGKSLESEARDILREALAASLWTSPRNAPRAYPGPLRTEAFCKIPDTAQAPFRDDMKN